MPFIALLLCADLTIFNAAVIPSYGTAALMPIIALRGTETTQVQEYK